MNVATRTLLATCIALAGIATVSPAAAQAVYSWKDAKGVTHYSDAPPAKGAATKRDVRPPTLTTTAAATAPKPKTDAKADEKDKADAAAAANPPAPQPDPQVAAAARAANCKTAQDNLAMLNSAAPVGVDKDGDGKTDEVLTYEQRTAQTQGMQAVVKNNCTP